jgi:hypothetical protein
MRWIIPAGGLFALSLASVMGQEKAAPKPAAGSVEQLIEKLGNRDYKTRESAGRALELCGFESLPKFRQALASTSSAEVRKRLAALIQNLERAQILSPTRLTLKLVDRPVADVIKEIIKQTGYPILNQSGNNPRVTLEMQNATFWEVLDRLCLIGGYTVYYNEGQGLVLSYNDYFTPCVTYRGPFKVVANNFNYNKTINFSPIPRNPANHQLRNESLTFSFTLHSEPKLPIMNVGTPRVLEALDENGGSLAPQQGSHETNYQIYSSYKTLMHGGSVSLMWPNKNAHIVKRLRIVLPVTLLSDQKPEITVSDLMKVKNAKFTGSNAELQIHEAKETRKNSTYEVKLTVRNTKPNASQDYSWANSIPQRIEAFDAKGNRLFSHGYSYESSSQGHMQATFMFSTNGDANIGPPARLIYNHWGMMSHQVEFEFKDLQLP